MQNNSLQIIIYICLCLFSIGCITRPKEELKPQKQMIQIHTKKSSIPKETDLYKQLKEDRDRIKILTNTPDRSGKYREDHSTTGPLATKGVLMKVLNLREDDNNFIATIKFLNNTGSGVTASVNLYAYDQDGRLVRTKSDNTFFRQQSAFLRQFSFRKRNNEVRWVISLAGNK